MGILKFVKNSIKASFLGLVLLVLTSCGGREDLAPVVELNWRAVNTRTANYVVKRGDTLYAIAFRYDRDYRELAAANHLYSPYSLRVGQVIHIQTGKNLTRTTSSNAFTQTKLTQRPLVQSQSTQQSAPIRRFFGGSNGWLWPAHGRVVANFIPTQGKKGIDIAGNKGDKIYAAKSGTVAYAGSGLAGYGNLIIIRHDNQFLTAYGNNEQNLVKEGQSIQAGQVIADMGVVDRRYRGVHFEIRQSGQPVNPLNFLK